MMMLKGESAVQVEAESAGNIFTDLIDTRIIPDLVIEEKTEKIIGEAVLREKAVVDVAAKKEKSNGLEAGDEDKVTVIKAFLKMLKTVKSAVIAKVRYDESREVKFRLFHHLVHANQQVTLLMPQHHALNVAII